MAFPFIGQQDAPQVRMTLEADAEKIEILALVPIGGGPDREDRTNRGVISRELYFEPQPQR